MSKNLIKNLTSARVEKDVENGYRSEISAARPSAVWASPHGCDGHATWEGAEAPATVRLLLEAKLDQNLKDRTAACNVLGQIVLYLKRFEQSGAPLPNVILVGDRNECFVLATSAVRGFLDMKIDWTVAPSKGNPELTRALVSGVNVLPFVHEVGDGFDFRALVRHVEVLAAGERASVRATPANLGAIFAYWRDRVFRTGKGGQALSPAAQADVFLRALFDPEGVYLHPIKPGILVVPGYADGVLVDADHWRSFFAHFEQGYRPSEVAVFMAMKDRLLDDDARRRQGAFFTPALWVAEAHKEVERVLGPDWRRDCVVWDPAAGTGNLTRDYYDFGCLVSSTAEKSDVEGMRQHGWGGHHVFQYDFLNPGGPSPFFEDAEQNVIPARADRALREAAREGKRLVFFMNPPYAEDGVAGAAGSTKAGVAAETKVAEACRKAKMGRVSRQLYAQFMFRCRQAAEQYGFKDYTVALFSKPTFMSSGSYRPFRDWWYAAHGYEGGFLFQASHFADVSGAWGVSFTVWNSGGKTDPMQDQPIRLTDERDFAVVTDAVKHVYSADDREASEWVEGPQKGGVGDTPKFSSGLKVAEKWAGGESPGSLGAMVSIGNNVMESGTGVYLLSGKPTHKGARHFDLLPSNWRRVVALFGARKLVAGNWINDKDEYLAPDEDAPGYEQWVNDCHVYALLHPSNNCTAMRDVQYKGKSWRIKNHWFWIKRADALRALDDKRTPTLYRDCQIEQAGDAYFAEQIDTITLSPDAQCVIDLARSLWHKSLPLRENYYAGRHVSDKEPDLHLNAWDAGVYQLKHLWKGLYSEEWEKLRAAHKALAERLRPGVYDYGFLRP
jgi:hypothetical protein